MRLRSHVSVAETDDGTVLLDEKSGKYWQLNLSGSMILRTLLADGTLEEAADAVVARYPVDGAQALADVQALVTSLTTARLVHP